MTITKSLRVLVCGSRHWTDARMIVESLLEVDMRYGISVVIHGGCGGKNPDGSLYGADYIAGVMADRMRIVVDWKTHGRAAGPIRNAKMLAEGKPDLVLAFTHDLEASKGTKDMVTRARAAGVRVVVLPAEREML